jgi:TonB-dependent receptor
MTNKFRIHHAIANFRVRLSGIVCAGLMLTGIGVSDGYSQVSSTTDSQQSNPQATSTELNRNGDFSVSDALLRLNGVYAGPRGEVNLRGVGYNRYRVTLDGQRLASTGLGDRSFDLMGIPADVAARIEWIRIVNADMDADGLAGSINLVTGEAMAEGRSLTLRVGGGANSDYYRLTGPMGRGSLQYQDRVSETVSLGLSLSYQQEYRGWEGLSTHFASRDFGDGAVDVIERFGPYAQTEGRNRLSGSVNLRFRPSTSQEYNLRVFINDDEKLGNQHRYSWLSNSSWVNQNTTTNQGRLGYTLSSNDQSVQTYAAHFGGANKFDRFQLDYNVGWSHSDAKNTAYHFRFEALNTPHTVDFDNRERPQAEPVNNFPRRQDMRLQPMDYIFDRHLETVYTGKADVTIPLSIVSVKTGLSVNSTHKNANEEGAFSHIIYTSRTPQTLNDFDELRISNFEVLGDAYELPWLANPESAKYFLNSSVPAFATNEQNNRRLTDIWNYGAFEDVYAGYAMATSSFGPLKLTAGLRYEQTEATYEGRIMTYDRFNRFVSTVDTSVSTSYSNLFPSVNVSFDATSRITAGVAYSQTIHRHSYNLLAPFQFVSGQDTTIFKGNPNMSPLTSNNIDVYGNARLSATSVISASVFHKSLANFISLQRNRVTYREGDIAAFDYIFEANPTFEEIEATEIQYRVGDESATIYGFEIALHHRFSYLPGPLTNLGLSGSYSYSSSDFENSRDEQLNLPGFSPQMANFSVDYSSRRLYANVTWQWAAETLVNLGEIERPAPSFDPENPVYLDEYSDGWNDVSLNLGVHLSQKVTLWANIYNVSGRDQVSYLNNRNVYPTGTSRRVDHGFMMGIKFAL